MFNAGIIARPYIPAAAVPYITFAPTALGGTATDTLARAIDTTNTADGDLLLYLCCCHWDANLAMLDNASDIVADAGNTTTGIAWRARVAGFDYLDSAFGTSLRVQAAGITAGIYGVLLPIRNASIGAFYDSSYNYGGPGSTPTFNALDVPAGGLVLAVTFFGDDTALSINQGPDTNWTRAYSQGSATGTDGRIVVDTFEPASNSTITPQSPRSNATTINWATIAVSIAPP